MVGRECWDWRLKCIEDTTEGSVGRRGLPDDVSLKYKPSAWHGAWNGAGTPSGFAE